MKHLIALGAMMATSAYAQNFEDWIVDELPGENSYYAATLNASKGLFGKVCSPDGCFWIITLQANCDAGSSYPALLSSDKGAAHVRLTCSPNTTTAGRYVFGDYDTIERAVESGDMIGIAIPMANGDFRVSRFSLRGFRPALNQLIVRVNTLLRQPGERRL